MGISLHQDLFERFTVHSSRLIKIDKIKAKIKAIPACLNFINYADIINLDITLLYDINTDLVRFSFLLPTNPLVDFLTTEP